MANASVQAFKAALRANAQRARGNAPARAENEANGLADKMRAAAGAHRKSGNTVNSIQVTKAGRKTRITAGGDLTTKEVRKGSGATFDYVRAEEFGTQKEIAIPFFFNTYRAERDGIKQRLAQGIASDLTS